MTFWSNVFEAIAVMPFDDLSVETAVSINSGLKRKRKQIDLPDLFIAATAIANDLPLTLNRKQFNRIDTLKLID